MRGKLHGLWEIVRAVLIVVISAVIIRAYIFQPFVVDGASMNPNLDTNQYILTEKINYRFHEPSRGDIIVFKYPLNPSISYIKRIIGLPGDEVKIFQGKVFVNNKLLDETYLANGESTYVNKVSEDQPYIIDLGTNDFFVMGDNRSHSSDSREWGVLPRNNIIGHLIFVIYPTSDFHKISGFQYN